MDTIFALATAQGRAGVSVVRMSGPEAVSICISLCGSVPAERVLSLRSIKDRQGSLIDEALVCYFRGPASFTGEDVVEFQIHGSVAVVRSILSELSSNPLARLAEPGEFTRRALENGKLDLAQVEGLADLIDAETEAQRRQAQRVLSGELGNRVDRWRAALIRSAALLEATIDFADEDVPVDVTPEVKSLVQEVKRDLQSEISGSFVAERIRSGFEVALVGAPNVGKSTLLNRLAGRDAAITSEIAGTTRDVIEVRMDLNGIPVTFLDTAGLREASDGIETIGIERAIARAKQADLRIFLTEDDEDLPLCSEPGDIQLLPKSDLRVDGRRGVSGKTGAGVSELLSDLESRFKERSSSVGIATHERHRTAMTSALAALDATQNVLLVGPDVYDLAAEELRTAIRKLESLVGRIGVENLLDEIFSSFCLGK